MFVLFFVLMHLCLSCSLVAVHMESMELFQIGMMWRHTRLCLRRSSAHETTQCICKTWLLWMWWRGVVQLPFKNGPSSKWSIRHKSRLFETTRHSSNFCLSASSELLHCSTPWRFWRSLVWSLEGSRVPLVNIDYLDSCETIWVTRGFPCDTDSVCLSSCKVRFTAGVPLPYEVK